MRGNVGKTSENRVAAGTFKPEDVATFTFNESTVFEGGEELQKQIMENGKNPGLGVRALHASGITGKSVSVAIIDQNLFTDHPEFKDKIAAYWAHPDMPAESTEMGSMHGPAVASLLAGETVGTAPGARLYYAAVPSWDGDSKVYADALNWIMETNKTLPESEKIRIVSISAAPSGEGSSFEKNLDLYDKAVAEAQAQGILVLDCRSDAKTGLVMPGFYDRAEPDNVEKMRAGFANEPSDIDLAGIAGYPVIVAPTGYRTMAEEYENSKPSYQYWGSGGLSWAIPYASGVLAMGLEVNPKLTGEELAALLIQSAHVGEYGNRLIDPPAFIVAVRNTVK
jgi:subtilisin family serine protease